MMLTLNTIAEQLLAMDDRDLKLIAQMMVEADREKANDLEHHFNLAQLSVICQEHERALNKEST
jgi:hypothetical protein